jgi:hypothetical protein
MCGRKRIFSENSLISRTDVSMAVRGNDELVDS